MSVAVRSVRAVAWTPVLAVGGLVTWRAARALAMGGISPDFFYYLVTARDWLQLAPGDAPNPAWYSYAPGIFRYYQALLASGVGSVVTLSGSINAFCLVDALLIGALLLRMGVLPLVAAWAAIWGAFAAEHYQGYGGLTEPLVVFPFLASLTLSAHPTRRFAEGHGWIALALGLGLSVYLKQPGALYLPAAVVAVAWSADTPMQGLFRGAELACGAAAVFLAALALEPGPISDALTPMFRMALTYDPLDAAPWDSLGGRRAADPKLAWLLVGILVSLLALVLTARGRRLLRTPRGALFGLAGLSALASAVQVAKRPYPHYLLMTWPFVVLACGLAMDSAARRLASGTALLGPAAGVALLMLPFCRLGGHPGPWLLPFSMASAPVLARSDVVRELPMVREALARIREDLGPAARVVVLPPRHNEVYWYLGYRHPFGEYRWPDTEGDFLSMPRLAPQLLAAVASPETRAVVFLNTPELRPAWVGPARAAGYSLARRSGPILWLRRP